MAEGWGGPSRRDTMNGSRALDPWTVDVAAGAAEDQTLVSVTALTKPLDMTVLILVIVLGCVGNVLIFGAVYAERSLRTSANVFVCNLAVCDLVITGYIVPFVLVNVAQGRDILADMPVMCTVNSLIVMSTCGLSIYTMALIAVNRYVSVCHPTRMGQIFSQRHICVMICAIWIVVPLLPCIPSFFTSGLQVFNYKIAYCLYDHRNVAYSVYLISLGIIGPTLVAAACYILIYNRIRQMKVTMSRETLSAAKRKRREQRCILMLFLSLLFFLLFWSPFALSALLDVRDTANGYFVKYSAWLALSNSCVNSWIYGIMNSNFRRGYKRVLCCFRNHDDLADDISRSVNGHSALPGREANQTETVTRM